MISCLRVSRVLDRKGPLRSPHTSGIITFFILVHGSLRGLFLSRTVGRLLGETRVWSGGEAWGAVAASTGQRGVTHPCFSLSCLLCVVADLFFRWRVPAASLPTPVAVELVWLRSRHAAARWCSLRLVMEMFVALPRASDSLAILAGLAVGPQATQRSCVAGGLGGRNGGSRRHHPSRHPRCRRGACAPPRARRAKFASAAAWCRGASAASVWAVRTSRTKNEKGAKGEYKAGPCIARKGDRTRAT